MLPFHICPRARCKRLLQALSLFVALGSAATVLAASPSAGTDAGTHAFHISAGPLAEALHQFIAQSGLQVLYDPALVEGHATAGIDSVSSSRAALDALLRNTGLVYEFTDSGTVVIKRAPATAKPRGAEARQPPAAEDAASPVTLQAVTVTGSRLAAASIEGPQEVKVYSSRQIAESGQKTVGDFLNTLSMVATNVTEAGLDSYTGAQTVRLRGLPIGSTLVLLDGRVVGGSAANQFHGNPFNLNFIPVSAVERIEVVPEAASAVYGSDAIGGVVNIILRKDLDGGELALTAGRPTEGGYDDSTVSFALGKNFSRGNVTTVGSFQDRSQLAAAERGLTANQDYRRFGGPDGRSSYCQPGNVYSLDGGNLPGLSSSFAGIPGNAGGTLAPADFLASQGVLNKCSPQATGAMLIPATRRSNVLVNGHYDFTGNAEGFFQLAYSRLRQDITASAYPISEVVPADNAFNPFGVPVLVNYRFVSAGPTTNGLGTDNFTRILGGLRGHWGDRWDWEVAAWQTRDRFRGQETVLDYDALDAAVASSDPAQSIDLFSSGMPASRAVLGSILHESPVTENSKLQTVNGFLRGTLFDLPTGPVEVVLGGEYNHEVQGAFIPGEGDVAPYSYSRNVRSLFAEARIPLLAAASASPQSGDRLALTLAGRYDHYNDFGGRFTPEAGLEFRPSDTLLLRASYGKSFKAPDLTNLYSSTETDAGEDSPPDPLRGGETYPVTYISGGNPEVQPQTGNSRTLGFVWSSQAIPNLQVALTNFRVTQNNRIVQPNPYLMVEDPDAFPSQLVQRAAPTPEDVARGYAGKILLIDARYLNFGGLLVEGFDLDAGYRFDTAAGAFSPSLSATEYYRYGSATPGAPLQDHLGRADYDVFAPRWKGSLALGWAKGAWSAQVAGRYLSRYLDYDQARTLGGYWLLDASVHWDIGKTFGGRDGFLANAYVDLSAVNATDRKTQYANFYGYGYDPREGDIRGRFVSFTFGTRW